MEDKHRLLLGFITVALCKCSAGWNTTTAAANKTVSCGPPDNSSNCTDGNDVHGWSGHFSECPEDYRHYCIHGTCQFVKEQDIPACRCESGYMGSRCEYLNLGWLVGERKEILIASIIAGLVILLLIIIFICISVRKRKKKRKKNNQYEVEKLNTKPDDVLSAAEDTSDTNTV